MSITFIKKQNNVLENITNIIYNSDTEDNYRQISDHLLKIFDSHYLTFISNRKQRDLIILNCFYEMILHNSVKVDKEIKQKYELSDFFEIKNNKIDISKNLLPISIEENILYLENEVQILKTLQLFFEKIVSTNIFFKQSLDIEIKINKIKDLNDNKIIERITTGQKIKSQILEKVGSVKNFNQCEINYNYYNVLLKEIELYGIKL